MVAVSAVACSSDAVRLAQNPNTNPYASQGAGDVTGSVPRAQAAPAGHVTATPLPPPPERNAAATGVTGEGISGGGRGLASYQPPANPDITGSVSAAQRAAPARPAWDWNGGTPITVGASDTVDSLAHKYGVPAAAIRQANGLAPGAPLKSGQHLVIPRLNPVASAQAAPAPNAAPASAKTALVANAHVHIVAPGETLTKIAKHYNKSLVELAKANNIPPYTKVSLGDRLVIPGVRAQGAAQAPAVAAAPAAPAPAAPRAGEQRSAAAEPPASAHVLTPAAEPQPAANSPVKTAEAAGFRWPVRGRVLEGFGAKANGQQNDGINVAVPEGTPIKAAEDGVVAYAGSELKGYGNLVLIRHSNGYVTAYAHASELLVKKNDQVKRGQTVARAGQTGSVQSPQLHFEIRKGSTPVDPAPFLDRGGG
jgi:murein DD-endopeptidase MepM/ murein hydrolase activator NlpD